MTGKNKKALELSFIWKTQELCVRVGPAKELMCPLVL